MLAQYRDSFSVKEYAGENDEHDVLMDVFGISPVLKRENRQFWGRELGMCWQRIVSELFRATVKEFGPGLRQGADELCDLIARRPCGPSPGSRSVGVVIASRWRAKSLYLWLISIPR